MLFPIEELARKLSLLPAEYESIGAYGAKLNLNLLENPAFPVRGTMVIVTAITPTTSGEGKTVVSIGLAQGLELIGRSAILTLRDPSLALFAKTGSAGGGGLAQIEPNRKINLHFHGDFHAIRSAHNLLAAAIDSHLSMGNAHDLDPMEISWPRAIDVYDPALRRINVSVGRADQGSNRSTGFVTTAASEIMAIMALTSSQADLRRRIDSIVVGSSRSGKPVTADNFNVTGAMLSLLEDAIKPNLVQTTEGTPALVHTGPSGSLAQGTSSILAHQMGVRLAEFVINECGFAADLGAEKYFDIVMRASGIKPAAAVLVVTGKSLKAQGEGKIEAGFANLDHHIRALRGYGVPTVVAINRFPSDQPEDLEIIATECSLQGIPCALVEAFAKGGRGATELAQKVVSAIAGNPRPEIQPVYSLDDPLETKLLKIAIQVYGADGVTFSEAARTKLDRCAEWGFGRLPVSIAKTPYSFTDDAKRSGAPRGWTLNVNDISLSAGAGFVVAIAANTSLMPGMPREMWIDAEDEGNIFDA